MQHIIQWATKVLKYQKSNRLKQNIDLQEFIPINIQTKEKKCSVIVIEIIIVIDAQTMAGII